MLPQLPPSLTGSPIRSTSSSPRCWPARARWARWPSCACVVVVSVFLSNVFRYLSLRLLAKVRARVIRNLRRDLYHRIIGLQLGFFSGERKGDLMSRFTNDVQEVETSVVNTHDGRDQGAAHHRGLLRGAVSHVGASSRCSPWFCCRFRAASSPPWPSGCARQAQLSQKHAGLHAVGD